MPHLTVTPAYGRDYKTAKAAKADFNANKDFIVNDHYNQYDGKPVNKEQLAGYSVILRFDSLRKITGVEA